MNKVKFIEMLERKIYSQTFSQTWQTLMKMHNYVNIVLALFDDTVVLACLYYRKDRNSLTDSTVYTNIALMYIYCLIYQSKQETYITLQ